MQGVVTGFLGNWLMVKVKALFYVFCDDFQVLGRIGRGVSVMVCISKETPAEPTVLSSLVQVTFSLTLYLDSLGIL